MSEIKLIIDGKEYICRPVEDTDAAAETTAESERPRTGYERVETGKRYYMFNPLGNGWHREGDIEYDDALLYNLGNYFNDEQLTVDIARADTIMRRLRQWQALNDKPVDWHDKPFYCIRFDYVYDEPGVECHDEYRDFGQIYFSTEAKAKEAIDVFRDDLMWYFTEYRQRLDEPERSA